MRALCALYHHTYGRASLGHGAARSAAVRKRPPRAERAGGGRGARGTRGGGNGGLAPAPPGPARPLGAAPRRSGARRCPAVRGSHGAALWERNSFLRRCPLCATRGEGGGNAGAASPHRHRGFDGGKAAGPARPARRKRCPRSAALTETGFQETLRLRECLVLERVCWNRTAAMGIPLVRSNSVLFISAFLPSLLQLSSRTRAALVRFEEGQLQ